MDTSHQDESVANGALSKLIKRVMHGRETDAESTQIIKKHPSMRPDLTIIAIGRSPVIIEAKYMHVPEHEVQKKAREHVGEHIHGQPHRIEAAIALCYPNRFGNADDIHEELKKTKDLEYCAVYPKGKRFPTTGWLQGSVCDLADLIHLVDVPMTASEKACDNLIQAINSINSYFINRAIIKMPKIDKIFNLLGLAEDPKDKDLRQKVRQERKRAQAGRMSGAILTNASSSKNASLTLAKKTAKKTSTSSPSINSSANTARARNKRR